MLTTQAHPCHYLAHPDGAEWNPGGDGTPHYDSPAKATQRVGSAAAGVADGLTVAQFAEPCATLTCDGDNCGSPATDGVWKTFHFTDEAEARLLADVMGFTVGPDGKAWCGDCLQLRASLAADEAAR